MSQEKIDHHKAEFALHLAERVMQQVETTVYPIYRNKTKVEIQLIILDAIEFGIQLGGMEFKEGD